MNMADILVVAEILEGAVKKTTLSAITFAREASKAIGGGFAVVAIGAGAEKAAGELAKFGATKVLVADDASLAGYVAEIWAPTIAGAAKSGGFAVVAGPASVFGKDVLPRVAAKLGAGYAADISAFRAEGGKILSKRPMFAGNAYGWVQIETAVQVISVRPSEFAAAEPSGGASPVEKIPAQKDAAAERVEFLTFDTVKSDRPELTEAKIVVSGGRSIKEKFMDVLTPLADTLGAAIGASRAACDAGYCSPELQVGQTGKVVAPQLYFAIGISGAIQHLAGMKGSKVIVAINKDPEAPIFQVADYGLVADLFTSVPALTEEIKKARA
jgi:electron transfer flavoprotein alpha subunit